MGNRKLEHRTFEMLEYYITKLKASYNDLSRLGEKNEVLEAAFDAYINQIYRRNIAKICNVNETFINDEILKYIQYGTKYDEIMPDGRYTMAYRPFTNEEVVAIVLRYLENNTFYRYEPQVPSNVRSPLENSLKSTMNVGTVQNTSTDVTPKVETEDAPSEEQETVQDEETITDITLGEDTYKSDTDYSALDEVEINPDELVAVEESKIENVEEPTNQEENKIDEKVEAPIEVKDEANVQEKVEVASPQPEVKDDKTIQNNETSLDLNANTKDKISTVQKYCAKLYEDYYKLGIKDDAKFQKIAVEEQNLYRKAIALLMGIKEEEVKDFVVNYVKGGITYTETNDKDESITKIRTLTDDEALLIAKNINNMTQEQVVALLNS